MLLSEEQAKQKSCPFGRLNRLVSLSLGEPPAPGSQTCLCTASSCMMWCWKETKVETEGQPGETGPNKGFCGLLGSQQ